MDNKKTRLDELAEKGSEQPRSNGTMPMGFRFLNINDLLATPSPPSWLVEGWMEQNIVAQLVGQPNSGKSLQALDWALRIATGTAWQGLAVEKAPVAYICGEGQAGMKRRVIAWQIHHEVELTGAPFVMSETAARLSNSEQAQEVFVALQQLPFEPKLLIIDTLARNMGGNENSTEDMSQFIHNVDLYLRQPFQATVLILHHTGHAGRDTGRGSTVLIGAIDNSFKMEEKDGLHALRAIKMRDADKPGETVQSIRAIELEGTDNFGNPFTAPVFTSVADSLVKTQGKLGKNQNKAMILIKALVEEYGVDCEPGDDVWVPVERWRDECHQVSIDRRRWKETTDALVDRNLVEMNEYHARIK